MEGLSKILAVGFPNGLDIFPKFWGCPGNPMKDFIGVGRGTYKNPTRIKEARMSFRGEKNQGVGCQREIRHGHPAPGIFFLDNFLVPTERKSPIRFTNLRKSVPFRIINKPNNPRNS
jgi:hypothetical protein